MYDNRARDIGKKEDGDSDGKRKMKGGKRRNRKRSGKDKEKIR